MPEEVLPCLRDVPLPRPTAPPSYGIEGVLDPYVLFGNRRTFRLCQIMVGERMSEASMNALIMSQHADTVDAEQGLLVNDASEVFAIYNRIVDEFGLRFTEVQFRIEAIDRTAVLFHRDPRKLARWLFLNPNTWGKVHYMPSPRYVNRSSDGSRMRVYDCFASAKWMEETCNQKPLGSTVMAIMESYDKSHMDLNGNQKAFGHYWVLNGLDSEEKQKMSNWWTFALRPIILTHKKMKRDMKALLTECNGQLRRSVNRLLVDMQSPLATDGTVMDSWDRSQQQAMYVCVSNSTVDREEAYGIADIRAGVKAKRGCTDCLAKTDTFHMGAASQAPSRRIYSERTRIERAQHLATTRRGNGGVAQAENLMKKYSNHMKDNPLWDMPHYGRHRRGPYSAVSWAQLHNFWKGEAQNITQLVYFKLLDEVYGSGTQGGGQQYRDAIDDWVKQHGVAFPTILESFPNGLNDFAQWDKKHYAALWRCLRCALHGVFADDACLGVIGRLLEWFKVAKLDAHTEDTLAFLHEEAGPQYAMARNELLRYLDDSHFDKDKAHQQAHVKDKIESYGPVDGQNDEGGETAHKKNLKENWRCRNNKRPLEQQRQMARNLELFDAHRLFGICEKYHLLRQGHLERQQAGHDATPPVHIPKEAPYAPSPAKLSSRTSCTLDLTSDFGVGTALHNAHNAFHGRRLERELRELLAGYPSRDGGQRRNIGNLPLMHSDNIIVCNMCHLQKRAGGPDYKVECAPLLHARFVPTSAIELHEHPKAFTHTVALTADDEQGGGLWFAEVLLLFRCFLDGPEPSSMAYVQYYQQAPWERLPNNQLPFPRFKAAMEADGGAYGVLDINDLLWLAPLVPDLRDAELLRLNMDAWM